MTTSTVPPSLPERLLRASVRDPEWREAITGDLREEFAALLAARGAAAARRWYWRQTIPLMARFVAARIVPSAAPPRHRRVSVAAIEATSLGAGWSREVRHAWRAVRQRPGLSITIAATLGVALASNAVVFNLADALYLRPFRFNDVDRLVLVVSDTVGDKPYINRQSVAPADFRDLSNRATSVTGMVAAEWWDPNLSGIDLPEQVPGFRVSPGFFELLGVSPVMGHGFTADDGTAGGRGTVVVSHAFWVRQFASDPGVLGRTVRLDGEPYEIVGVMPPRFSIPFGADVWAPVAYDNATWADRARGYLMVMGRLAPGHTVETADGEFRGLAAQLAAEFPDTNRERPASVVTFSRGMGDEGVGPFVAIWQVAAILLLCVACANIANLMLARGAERQPEFAVRLALGAGRGRLVYQLLVEGLALSLAGLALGGGLTVVAMRYVRAFLPANIVRFVPGYQFLGVDATTLAAMAALGALATTLFSVLPALTVTRSTTAMSAFGSMRTATGLPGRQWLRSALAVGQVALTLALAVAATLINGAVDRAVNGVLGFEKRGVATARLTLPERPYAELERRRQFVDGVLARVGALPGVTHVAAVSSLPYGGNNASRPFLPEGTPEDAKRRAVTFQRVTPGYFATLAVPIVAGRALEESDREDGPQVAVVSRRLADQFWPGSDPLGRRFRLAPDGPWVTVVGIAGDVLQEWFTGRMEPTVYRPMRQDPGLSMAVLAKTGAPPSALLAEMRRTIAAVDQDQPVQSAQTMDEVVDERVAGVVFFARMLTVMTAIALILALTGLYSLVAYLTARRTREIGVRVALGATSGQVQWLAAERALFIVGAGVVSGGALALVLGKVMQSALFGLIAPSTAVVAGTVATLTMATMVAGYLPARKAAARDPWQALRSE